MSWAGDHTPGPVLRIDSLHFDGFDQAWADRSQAALEAALLAGARDLDLPANLRVHLNDMTLSGVDFSSPERMGETLAAALLARIGS